MDEKQKEIVKEDIQNKLTSLLQTLNNVIDDNVSSVCKYTKISKVVNKTEDRITIIEKKLERWHKQLIELKDELTRIRLIFEVYYQSFSTKMNEIVDVSLKTSTAIVKGVKGVKKGKEKEEESVKE